MSNAPALSNSGEPNPGSVRVRAWIHKWLQDVARHNLAISTFGSYRSIAKNHVVRLVGGVRLTELAPRHVASMERCLTDEGYCPGVIVSARSILSGACKYAIQQGLIDRNPARSAVKRSKPLKPVDELETDTNRQPGHVDPWAIAERSDISIAEWLIHWLGIVQHTRKATTYERYLSIAQNQIIPLLGAIELKELAPRQVDAMQRHLLESELSPWTVANILTVLSVACKYAYRLEIIDRNPVDRVERPKRRRRRVTPPDVPTVRRLLFLARTEYPYLHPFLHMLAFTGMRRGEAMALRWHNVNLVEGYLSVAESVVKTQFNGLVVDTPKTASSERVIDLDGGTILMLSEHRRNQLLAHRARGGTGSPELVFTDAYGSHFKPTNMTRALKYLGRKAGAPDITFHQLRHFHASLALQGKQNIAVVSRRLGHSSVTMTLDAYGHAMAGWQQGVADAVAEAMDDDPDNHERDDDPEVRYG